MHSSSRFARTLLWLLPLLQLAGCWDTSSNSSGSTSAAPTTLTVSAVAGNTRVALSWNAIANASAYHVKRSTLSGGPYTQIAAPTTAAYLDVGLTNGVTYYYVVSFVIAGSESVNSSEVNATPMAASGVTAAVPAIPAGLIATAGNAQVSLSWTAVSGSAAYYVKRGSTDGGPYTVITDTTASAYIDTGLTNGTTYFYVVSAFNDAGESANSTAASATPLAPVPPPPPLQIPAVPTGLVAAAGVAQVNLVWTASATAATYNVQRSTTSGGPYTAIGVTTSGAYADAAVTGGVTYYYVVSAVNAAGTSANSTQANATPITPDVVVTVNPANAQPISPYIYGVNNFATTTGAPPALTLDRSGGDRWTAYNWQTNASNSGEYPGVGGDWSNDNFLSASATPAEAVRSRIAADQTGGMASIITFQLQGLVSADENGPVDMSSPPQSDAASFKTVVDAKASVTNAPFTLTPSNANANVYMDEFAWALDQKFSGQGIFSAAPTTHPVFAELDNEPELWNSVELEVQGPTLVTPTAYIQNSIALAEALKNQFPNMILFGPVHYGFEGIYNWQGALTATPTGNNWFPDLYLPQLKTAASTYGKPVIDVYDFHWASEATDGNGNRVTDLPGPTLTDAQVEAIVESPRSLWDTSYTENSWITADVLNGPIYILGRLQSRIAAENPGMKVAITDYSNGGGLHIAGTIAQADNLGIFGAQGLFAATLTTANTDEPYTLAGFRAFRDFDGANSNFGDTSLAASSSNVQHVAAYVSTDSTQPGRTVLVLINRSFSSQVVAVEGQPVAGTAHVYQMTAASAAGQTTVQPVASGTQPVSGSTVAFTLPALSVTTVDIH